MWKLSGCPMAGPLVVGQETLWNDASTGERRTLLAVGLDEDPRVLLESDEEFNVLYPLRQVAGDAGVGPLFLLPADPTGRLIHRDPDGTWEVLPDMIPRWITSAAALDGGLFVAGVRGGKLRIETLPLPL